MKLLRFNIAQEKQKFVYALLSTLQKNNVTRISVSSKFGIVKGKKTPHLDNDVIVKIPKLHLSTRTEFGNNDFQNQRIQASKNTYVAKKSVKNACGCHDLVSCVPHYTRAKKCKLLCYNNSQQFLR